MSTFLKKSLPESAWISQEIWTADYTWFIVDEGRIDYAFKSKDDALAYQKLSPMVYLTSILVDLDDVSDILGTTPDDESCWLHKTPRCVSRAI